MALTPGSEPSPDRRSVIAAKAVIVAIILYIAACAFGRSYGLAFFSIPFFVGLTVGALAYERPYRTACIGLGLAMALAVITLQEGVICLLFALPIVVPLLFVGAACGSVLRRKARSKQQLQGFLNLTLALGLMSHPLEATFDNPAQHPIHHATSELVIAASPAQVFATLTARTLEVAPRWPWFLSIGLPMPQKLEFTTPGPHGELRLQFSQGTAFAHVTAYQENAELAFNVHRYEIRDLPFHITRLGKSPDYGFRAERVQDWLTLIDLRYTLAPTPDGRTLLRRETRWRRHLFPSLYFGWLQQTVIRRGQIRLLDLLRERIESQPRSTPIRVAARAG